jgi:hypothetical protein
MPDASVQTYANHARWLPPWHFFVLPVLYANAIMSIVTLAKNASLGTFWAALVAVALGLGMTLARWMPLRMQDRIICLEESLRLESLLPGRHLDIEKLTRDHLIALRFASDEEVPHLVDRILAGEIGKRDEIKRAVQHWRPDHLRA